MRANHRVLIIAFAAALGVAVLAAPGAQAQGTITAGIAEWEYNAGIAGTTSANADFRISGTDNVFQAWWWYRVSGDASETIFPVPDSQTYVGNVATLTWADVDGRGFAAEAVDTVSSSGGGTTILDLTLTNNTGGTLTIEVFLYIDFDVGGSAGGDSATLTNPNDYITITDGGTTAEFRGIGSSAYQVTTFSTLRGLLIDGAVTNLNNTGLPFGPGDFTGAFQWSAAIPAAGSQVFRGVASVNEMAVPVELTGFSIE